MTNNSLSLVERIHKIVKEADEHAKGYNCEVELISVDQNKFVAKMLYCDVGGDVVAQVELVDLLMNLSSEDKNNTQMEVAGINLFRYLFV